MKHLSESEENYIKALYYVGEKAYVSNGDLAARIGAKGSSVTQALKRLEAKLLVEVVPYKGTKLTAAGVKCALQILRKHRLWEVFLVEKLGFGWDQVHYIAEQMEHVQSPDLVDKLDQYLGRPSVDPHGDPIPNANGEMPNIQGEKLSNAKEGATVEVVRVEDAGPSFFDQLASLGISLGKSYQVQRSGSFDGSIELAEKGGQPFWVSAALCNNIYTVPK